MKKLVWFFMLLLCSSSTYAQNLNNLILSDFERAFYTDSKGVVLDYEFVEAHQLGITGEFLQIFVVKATSLDDAESSQKALVISHSNRREFLGKHDFIDADEIDNLINALEYYSKSLAGTKPKNYQSFIWTSRGGYQIQGTCSLDFPRRYILNSKIDALNNALIGATLFDKKVDKWIATLKGAKVMVESKK